MTYGRYFFSSVPKWGRELEFTSVARVAGNGGRVLEPLYGGAEAWKKGRRCDALRAGEGGSHDPALATVLRLQIRSILH